MNLCPVCTEFFEPVRRGHTFCSTRCGQRARERERRGLPIEDSAQPADGYRKITEEDAEAIAALLLQGADAGGIAAAYGVSRATIYRRSYLYR